MYKNGLLQTEVKQNAVELEGLRKADVECTQYRQLAEAQQSKYSQVCRINRWTGVQERFTTDRSQTERRRVRRTEKS